MAEYIDREAAYNDFERFNSDDKKWTPIRVKAFIARQKSSDVAPVVHAHIVINDDGDCHCSNCGEFADSGKRFCASCGARLDEPEMREW